MSADRIIARYLIETPLAVERAAALFHYKMCSTFDHGLVAHLKRTGILPPQEPATALPEADRVLVVSGSAAPQTAAQIQRAEEKGFATVRIAVENVLSPEGGKIELERVGAAAEEKLKAGRSVVVYSARGPNDGRMAENAPQLRTVLGTWQGDLYFEQVRKGQTEASYGEQLRQHDLTS